MSAGTANPHSQAWSPTRIDGLCRRCPAARLAVAALLLHNRSRCTTERANHCPVRKLKVAPVADPTIGEKAGSERTWLKVVQAVKAVRLFGGPKAM